MKARIYLKSGAVVDTDVEDITTQSHGGELTSINWTKSEKGYRMVFVAVADISAITVLQK